MVIVSDTVYLTPTQPSTLPLIFEGSGNQVTDPFVLEEGLHIVRVTKTLNSYFILHLIDGETGEIAESILNENDSEPEVSQAFQVKKTGIYGV